MDPHHRHLEQVWVLAPQADLSRLEARVTDAVTKFFDRLTDNCGWQVVSPIGSYALWCRGKWVGSVLLWHTQQPIPAAALRRALPVGAKVWQVHDNGKQWGIDGPDGIVLAPTTAPWHEASGFPDRKQQMAAAEGILHTHLKEALMDVPACSAWVNAVQDDRPKDLEALLKDQFWTREDIEEWWRFVKDYILAPQPVHLSAGDHTWGPQGDSDTVRRQTKTFHVLHALACALPFHERKPARLNAVLTAAEHGSWRVQSVGMGYVEHVLRAWLPFAAFWRRRGRTVNLEGPSINGPGQVVDFQQLPQRAAYAALNAAWAKMQAGHNPRPQPDETYLTTVRLQEAAPKWPHWMEVFNQLALRDSACHEVRQKAAELRSQHLGMQWEEAKVTSSRPRM